MNKKKESCLVLGLSAEAPKERRRMS